MACDATARLYDVDEDSVTFEKLDKTKKYDQGVVRFRARKGKLIDLDKLHESIWATRLSGGTRSGLVSLEVTTTGKLRTENGVTFLSVANSDREFELLIHPDAKFTMADMRNAVEEGRQVEVTGQIANYSGQWPKVLSQKPEEIRKLQVKSFE